MLAIQMVIIHYFAEPVDMFSTKIKLYEYIDMWMDNHDNVNQYSRTDLMQTEALIIFVCVSVNDRDMSIKILF